MLSKYNSHTFLMMFTVESVQHGSPFHDQLHKNSGVSDINNIIAGAGHWMNI